MTSELRGDVALVLVSAAVLALEVLLTRVLAYTVHELLLYVVLGLALLGFGAAGSLTTLFPAWFAPEHRRHALLLSALGASAAVVLSNAAFARLSPWLVTRSLWALSAAVFALSMPFLGAGVFVVVALTSEGTRLARRYALNLVGSAAGALAPLALLGPLSAGQMLGALALTLFAAAMVLAASGMPRGTIISAAVTLALGVGACGAPDRVFPISADPTGQVAHLERIARGAGIQTRKLYDRWNPTGRVEVFEYKRESPSTDLDPFRFYAHDGTAGAIMVRWQSQELEALCTDSLYAQAYTAPRRRVVVIGVGGGIDVQCALLRGARRIDAVEINPDAIRAIAAFERFLGRIVEDSRVRYHVLDGRSFVAAAEPRSIDLIQLSGVDTKHALASGGLALSENRLYTLEAFGDYLEALSPSGSISILRFDEWEALRLANTAIAALHRVGAKRPAEHVVILENRRIYGVLVKAAPFTPTEVEKIYGAFGARGRAFRGTFVPHLEAFGFTLNAPPTAAYLPGHTVVPPFDRYFRSIEQGRIAAFELAYPTAISPTTDDRPFFFDLANHERSGSEPFPHVAVLKSVLVTVIFLAFALVLLPVWRLRDGGAREKGFKFRLLAAVGFGALGMGYLAVEVWLIHRLSTFLGHQTYATAAVLAALLVSSGAGALLGQRFFPSESKRFAVGLVATLALLGAVAGASGPLVAATNGASVSLRAAVAAATVVLPGFAMGLPFPSALAHIIARRPAHAPWYVGINAFGSVLASVGALPLALMHGYSAVLVAGASCYALAAVLVPSFADS